MTSVRSVPAPPSDLLAVDVRDAVSDERSDVMNFLNEITAEFPDAISFAPGRPLESLFGVEEHLNGVDLYVRMSAAQTGRSLGAVWSELGQYCRTNGLIGDTIATQLRRDEGIDVPPEAIVTTVGAQEAMAIVLAGLFDPARDILLVRDPTYVGITGLARLMSIRVVPVTGDDDGLDPESVERTIVGASRGGRVRALYDIPDFNNPLGTSLPLDRRHALLDVCSRHRVLLIEDNAYGMFAYDAARPPTLKALDKHGSVLYIGSYSKTLFPGLRVGYLIANQRMSSMTGVLAQALSRVKSLFTVNTPPLLQAAVAGALLQHGGSLEPIVAPKRAQYKRQRDAMLAALAESLGDVPGVTWNRPAGGFFLTVTLPFEFAAADLRECARTYGVIVTPMRFFAAGSPRVHQIRLSFSYVEPQSIGEGIRRLAAFVRDRLSGTKDVER
jgi:(S)-3,5-dihydroxyphenylglycine transaminase